MVRSAVALVFVAVLTLPAGAAYASSDGSRPLTTVAGADLCAQVGIAAGFPHDARLVTGIAIGMAESHCAPAARGNNTASPGCPDGSNDRGMWQINSCWHDEVTDGCAFEPLCAAGAAFVISHGGTDWSPWTTFDNGRYLAYMSAAQDALNRLCATTCGPTGVVVANPMVNVRSAPKLSAHVSGHARHGDRVRVVCWVTGDQVNQGRWPSGIWDSIVDSGTGATGYAADAYVRTSTDVRSLVPAC
jgi:hypothetical protein